MKKIFCSILLLTMITALHASDTIVVKKGPRLDVLTAKQAQINKRAASMTSAGMYKGFRVQVISTNSRDEAFKIKADLLTKFPDQKTYTLFQSPFFKVRIGNFLKKEDADKFRKQLSALFPGGVYIVEDAIDYTPKGDEEPVAQ